MSNIESLADYKRKNMTRYEKRLWFRFLRDWHYTVICQAIIGDYIVDFFVPAWKLCIEIDGGGHYTGSGERADAERNRFLEERGYTVVHYSNSDVWYNLPGVAEDIMSHCGE